MTVNKSKLVLTALTGFLCWTSTPAQAANIVPSLYNIQDIVVDLARLGNINAASNCNVFKRKVSDQTLAALRQDRLPARSSLGKDTANKDKISVTLVPEVVSLMPRDKLCVSWVAFNVESRNAINLPPANYHRDMKLTYWKAGLLVSTSPHSHERGINEAIKKLSNQFVQQYNRDQPPTLDKNATKLLP